MLPAEEFATVASSEGWGLAAGCPARTRFTTADDIPAFVRRPLAAPDAIEHLTAQETTREDVMLGMRLTRGVSAEQVDAAGLTAVLESLAADGLVERTGPAESWRATERGWLLGNRVFGRIWAGE